MSKDPAFLFYSSDFLTGVSDLTFEERGQYITLLCLQHQKGHLSEKAIKIAAPNATADVLAKFEKDAEGNFFNERLEKEANKRSEHAEKQRQRAKKGWEKRKRQQSRDNATASATAMPLEDEDVNKDDNRNKSKTEKPKRAKPKKQAAIQDQVVLPFQTKQFEEWWLRYLQMRIDCHKFTYSSPTTEQTALSNLNDLSGHNETKAIQIIKQTLQNEWKGFFELKNDNNGKAKRDSEKFEEFHREHKNNPIYKNL